MLIEKQRLTIKTELDIWRSDLLQAGLLEFPLQGATAVRAAQLQLFHGDPADHIIVATAIENTAALMTADEKILSWNRFQHTIDARM